MKFIGLLDCNNFFVSCERLFRPDLRTRPTIVLSSNDGCAVARSQEIKDKGIPMGVPYFKIKDILKDSKPAIFSSNFRLYRDISRRVFSILGESVTMEQYSIDEAFFTLTVDSIADATERVTQIKRCIEQSTGIPVSIGLASSKTQAKYASRLAKKATGVQVLTSSAFTALASEIALGEVWGIGTRLTLRCKKHELHTVQDLLNADEARIARLFGVAGVRLQRELAGEVVFPVEQTQLVQKSVMSTRSFKTTTTELAVVEDAVAYHVRQALEDIRAMGHLAQTLRVLIRPSRHGDYALRGGSLGVYLPAPTADTSVCIREAMRLTQALFESGVPYKKAGVMLGDFVPTTATQQSLFPETEQDTSAQLMKTLDTLNTRFGTETIQIGSRLRRNEWINRREQLSPHYTTNWSDIATVTAK